MKLARRLLKAALKLVLAILVLGGFAAALWGPDRLMAFATGESSKSSTDAEEVRFYTAQLQDLVIAVKERGTLRATQNVKVKVPFDRRRGGEAIIAWLKPEGEEVKEGDLIIQFEKKSFEDGIKNGEEQLAEQKKQLEIAIKNIEIEQADGDAVVAAAVTHLEDTEEALRRYREEEAPKKRRSLIDAKRTARDKLETAREKLTDVQREADEQLMGDESAQEKARDSIEKAREQVAAAEKAYEDASSNQKTFRSREYPDTLAKKTESVNNAMLELKRKQVNTVNRVENQRTTVRRYEQQIERTEKQLETHRENLKVADVHAPVAGRLIYGDTDRGWPRPEDIKVGNRLWAGYNIMTIPDESVFEIDIYVAEEYRYRLKEGASAQVTISAIAGLEMEGVVKIIENFAKTPPGGGPKKYRASISIDKGDDRLASGMGAEVSVIAETVPDVLVVPIEAVFNIQGTTVCFVQDGDELGRREVKTGKSNDHYVQILDGLEEGEQVSLTRPAGVDRSREKEDEPEEDAPAAGGPASGGPGGPPGGPGRGGPR